MTLDDMAPAHNPNFGIGRFFADQWRDNPSDAAEFHLHDETPAFVKAEQSLYPNGPVWRIELTSPVWPRAPNSSR